MFKIPDDLLVKAKCKTCNHRIYCSPVFQLRTGGNICSKCSETYDQHDLIRNILFEQIGSLFLHPCKHHNEGCAELLKWSELKQHQQNCEFGQLIPCPSLLSDGCKWQGSLTQLYRHYQETHPDLIAHKQKKITPFETSKTLIMKLYDFLFAIHIQVGRDNSKVQVSMLDFPALAPHFEYHVEVNNHNALAMKGNDIYVEQVNQFFDENFKNNTVKMKASLNIAVNVKRNQIKCLNCNKTSIKVTKTGSESCCKDFRFSRIEGNNSKKQLRRCFLSCKGCKYVGEVDDARKHMLLLCRYVVGRMCLQCLALVGQSRMSMFEHQRCTHYKQSFTGEIYLRETRTQFLGESFVHLRTEHATFLCRWALNAKMEINPIKKIGLFSVDIVSDLPPSQEEGLEFSVKLVELRLGAQIENKLTRQPGNPFNNGGWEWFVEFDIAWDAIYFDYLYHSLHITLSKK